MKKILVVVLVVALALLGANAAMAAIANTKHDLSSTSTNSIAETVANLSSCQFCHTPHLGSNTVVVGAPLWNRSISAVASFDTGSSVGQYQVYGAIFANVSGATLSGTTVGAPGPNSKTCLSCHDGSLSIGNVLVGTNTAGFTDATGNLDGQGRLTTGRKALGTDLTNEHPIGIVVPAAGGGSAGLDTIVNMKLDGAKFYESDTKMECGTCHDPHESSAAKSPFLRMAKATMCSDCHITK